MRAHASPIWCSILMLVSATVQAQDRVLGPVPLTDPSVRHEAMGGTATGVFWTGGEASWGNPAALGSVRGVQFQWSEADATKQFFSAQCFRGGAFGVGFELNGEPGGVGFARQDSRIDQWPVTVYDYRDEVHSWAVGTNLLEVVDQVRRFASTGARSLSTILDVSLGYGEKDWQQWVLYDPFAPAPVTAKLIDRGLRMRVSPYNSINAGGWFWKGASGEDGSAGTRIEFGYGYSRQNTHDPNIPVFPESCRHGLASRVDIGFPASWRNGIDRSRLRSLFGRSVPLVSLGAAWDHVTGTFPLRTFLTPGGIVAAKSLDLGGVPRGPTFTMESDQLGLELEFAGLLALRYGHVRDARTKGLTLDLPNFYLGLPTGITFGIGAGLQLFDSIVLRYDFASLDYSEYHSRVHRHAIVVAIEGLGTNRTLRVR